jgi:hypothetical protein
MYVNFITPHRTTLSPAFYNRETYLNGMLHFEKLVS